MSLALTVLGGCRTTATVPAPEPVVAAYTEAVKSGDAAAIYELMSDESRRAISQDELARVLAEQQKELSEHADSLRSKGSLLTARAEVRYDDGEIVSLDLVDGAFRVSAADALPGAARTPAQALGQLRRVLARRSYPGLLRVLSPRTRAAVERDLRSLVEGLAEPEALQIDETGDAATVDVPGGHQVKLRREDGVWYIDDFD
jgi:hypothetical protein